MLSARILVVDDSQQKLARLTALLKQAGAERSAIDLAQTGVHARELLAGHRYDLLILDIALPMRADDAPDRRGGLTLLEEVAESGNFKLPVHVVGLTGFEDLQEEFTSRFHSRMWILELYQSTETGWIDRLEALVRYIIARTEQPDEYHFEVDLCILTALHQPELTAVLKLPWGWAAPRSLDGIGFYYSGSLVAAGKKRTVVIAAAPRMGMVATAVLGTKMILKFRPRALVMSGICAGLEGGSAIGDVLVADPSWDWQMGKFTKGGFRTAPDHIDIPTEVGQQFGQLANDGQLWFNIWDSYEGVKPANIPTVKTGPVTSGAAVIADSKILRGIRAQHRKTLGVEMEFYGMYAAARDCPAPRPITFGVKSVCDFADNQKGDEFQNYSAYVSAKALQAFFERFGGDIFGK